MVPKIQKKESARLKIANIFFLFLWNKPANPRPIPIKRRAKEANPTAVKTVFPGDLPRVNEKQTKDAMARMLMMKDAIPKPECFFSITGRG
jgi:hypothetical protein